MNTARSVRFAACLLVAVLAACAVPHDAPRRVTPPPMPGGWYGHAQPSAPSRPAPVHEALPVQQAAPTAYGAAPQPTPRIDAWGQPIAAAGAPAPMPASAPQQQQPSASSRPLDPWSSGPADTASSRVIAPHTAPDPKAPPGAMDQALSAATGRRPVPGSAGLETRNVYDADGGPSRALAPGQVGKLGGAERELELSGSGRMYLLEMYQQALDDRDALEIEVGTLMSRIEQLQVRLAETTGELATERDARAALERDVAALRTENQDLAARLVTAQIRRLEAEKMLLEARIEQERAAQPAPEVPARQPAPAGRP